MDVTAQLQALILGWRARTWTAPHSCGRQAWGAADERCLTWTGSPGAGVKLALSQARVTLRQPVSRGVGLSAYRGATTFFLEVGSVRTTQLLHMCFHVSSRFATRQLVTACAVALGAAALVAGTPQYLRAQTTAPATQEIEGFPRKSNSPEAQQARQAQDAFEQTHRQGLRFYNGGADATCEEAIGRICYWNNNGDVPPPAERSDAKVERTQLIGILERAAKASPGDDWVVGMLVRYDIEADRPDSALRAARGCAGTGWWCSALQGLALHTVSEHVAATAAFQRMLKEMPQNMRCEWTEIGLWLSSDSATQRAYRARPCEERMKSDLKLFRLAQPLWSVPTNDLYNELLARHAMSTVHGLGRIPYDIGWGADLLESQVRYGWPVNWSVQNGGVGDPRPPSVIGHEPTPSYDFLANTSALANPFTATAADWPLNRRKARTRYAPRYASGFGVPPYQFARFRRGDSTVVAGAYRLIRELEMGRGPYNAALVLDALDDKMPMIMRRDNAAANGAILTKIGATPFLASLEIVAPNGRRAARVREAVQPLAATRKVSDILLTTRGDPSGQPSLESAASMAFGGADIDGGTTIGLYWENYLDVSPATPAQTSIRATRVGASFMQRLSSTLRLSKAVQPVSQRISDPGRPDGLPGRSISLSWPQVPDGDYLLTLMVQNASGKDSTSTLIRVRDRK